MIFQFLLLSIILSTPFEEEQVISCSCKKKKKSTYKENTIACFCEEEPLEEELLVPSKRLFKALHPVT